MGFFKGRSNNLKKDKVVTVPPPPKAEPILSKSSAIDPRHLQAQVCDMRSQLSRLEQQLASMHQSTRASSANHSYEDKVKSFGPRSGVSRSCVSPQQNVESHLPPPVEVIFIPHAPTKQTLSKEETTQRSTSEKSFVVTRAKGNVAANAAAFESRSHKRAPAAFEGKPASRGVRDEIHVQPRQEWTCSSPKTPFPKKEKPQFQRRKVVRALDESRLQFQGPPATSTSASSSSSLSSPSNLSPMAKVVEYPKNAKPIKAIPGPARHFPCASFQCPTVQQACTEENSSKGCKPNDRDSIFRLPATQPRKEVRASYAAGLKTQKESQLTPASAKGTSTKSPWPQDIPKAGSQPQDLLSAIQAGVALKHVETSSQSKSRQGKKPMMSPLLAKLQQRKQAYMRKSQERSVR